MTQAKRAKNRSEPQNMTSSSETEIFLGGPNGKVVPPGIVVIKYGYKTVKIGPKYSFLVILGQIFPFFAHFVQCPTKKQCEQGA